MLPRAPPPTKVAKTATAKIDFFIEITPKISRLKNNFFEQKNTDLHPSFSVTHDASDKSFEVLKSCRTGSLNPNKNIVALSRNPQ